MSCSTQVLFIQNATITYIYPRDGSSTPSVTMFQIRKVFLLCWIPESDRNQAGNHSNGARWYWQAICMSVYRKQGCSMPCKHLQGWTARFEPHVSEGSNMFSVTLIKIRRKKLPLKSPGRNTFNTHTHRRRQNSHNLNQFRPIPEGAPHPFCLFPPHLFYAISF